MVTLAVIIFILLAAIAVPFAVFSLGERTAGRFKATLAANVVSFFGALLLATLFVFYGAANAAEAAAEVGGGGAEGFAAGMAFLGAAISTGLGSIGAGVATGQAASAALGAISENEGIMGRAIIFVGLAEGVAIYGLIISFMILGRV